MWRVSLSVGHRLEPLLTGVPPNVAAMPGSEIVIAPRFSMLVNTAPTDVDVGSIVDATADEGTEMFRLSCTSPGVL